MVKKGLGHKFLNLITPSPDHGEYEVNLQCRVELSFLAVDSKCQGRSLRRRSI